ncbi:MAG: transporter, stomatin/podocin/band 7/nephrosis [Chthonomonadaceae bacterium]|nr:transporter, stomatin/podocin/band 7/nephrosis [Chthonomonadaceae bacterium]
MTATSNTKRTILIVAGVLVVGFLLFRPYVIVPAGERVVVFSLYGGVIPTQLNEGFHFITPFIDHPEFYDARQQTYSISKTSWEGEVKGEDSIRCLTSDGQEVSVELSMRFHIDPNNVWRLHKEIGKDYISKIIRPELRSHTRIAIAEFPADRVYSAERVAIQTNLETRLREKLAHNYIQVDEVLLRAITFSDAYQNAIIQKQISQQTAQRMQSVLAQEQQETRRKIILAEGEAESIRLKGQAIATNPRVVAYQYVQKIAPNIKTILSSGNVPLPTVGTDKP